MEQPIVTADANASDDDVIATVYVGTSAGRHCHGNVRSAGLAEPLPALQTDDTGGGRWRWKVADDVPAGRWRVRVTCRLVIGPSTEETSFQASYGHRTGRHPRSLAIPGSMRAEPWHSKRVTHGIGGGGGNRDEGGYPKGQCTWWARLRRPDLPVFPGPAGDAAHWADSARRADPPFRVGKKAKPGAIVVFQPGEAGAGEHGHVAYVEEVRKSQMVISEANFLDTKPGHERSLRWRGQGFEFIYEREGKKPKPPGPEPPNSHRYYVFRTCANGTCGLKQRSGPATTFAQVGVPLLDGTAVDVVCQTKGQRVVGADATSTDVWDRLFDGSFVSDYFVDTPGKRDQFTVPLPDCSQVAPPPQPPPTPAIELVTPASETILGGTAELIASSNAPAVRFDALYSTTPGVKGSATWHTLGVDSSPADGFRLLWDTTAIPNQGLGNQETVQIAATALDASGGSTAVSDASQVAVANPNLDGTFSYHVYNTCELPKCELNKRSGPGFSEYPVVGTVKEGAEIKIACQVHGQLVTGSEGTSDVWDRFDDGSWGADYYIDTPLIGKLSPPIPECDSIPPPPTLEVELKEPKAGTTVTGVVDVEAIGNGPAVRFEAFYSETPEVAETAAWFLLGQDNTPSDGFTVRWDTTSVPNQGLPSLNTVRVRAVALNYRNEPTNVQSVHRVAASNPGEDGSFRYHVFGTCANGGDCQSELYAGPGYSSYSVVGVVDEDDPLDVVCQAHGETFVGSMSTDIWDKLTDGSWITDYFVETPTAGAFSPPIPVCG